MPAFAAQTLPPGHGLGAGEITVDAGQSMEHGNVVVSCPAGVQACVLNVAVDGSASYERTGGIPSIMPAFAAQTLPPGHGLGAARWNGGLLGFTPALEVVGGNAGLVVNLGTMNGRADFTELQSWAAGATPGVLGTGSRWNTGSLGYTIAVGANYLRSTGGDDGTVNGQFYGASHEGVAGSLERDDLTAAFGATRN